MQGWVDLVTFVCEEMPLWHKSQDQLLTCLCGSRYRRPPVLWVLSCAYQASWHQPAWSSAVLALWERVQHAATCQADHLQILPGIVTIFLVVKKRKGSPYSIAERRVPELIPVLGSQPAGDVSNKPGGRLPLLSTRPAVTPATLKRAATSFPAWWTEARWVWTVCLRLLSDSVATAIWTRALLHLSPAR